MCVTCGCSADAKVILTSLTSVNQLALKKVSPQRIKSLNRFLNHNHHHVQPQLQNPERDQEKEVKVIDPEKTTQTINLEQEVLAKNDFMANQIRKYFEERNILALNLMSSPGSGKTTLLERTIRDLKKDIEINVIEGDQETTNDADRIRATGCKVVQINTGVGCHLEAQMLSRGIEKLNPSSHSVVMIENVGNLVCPALFDLGEKSKLVIFSVTEGEDKPLKYPHIFRQAKLLILNKIDLLPYLKFDVDRCLEYARQVNPKIEVIKISASRGDGMEEWYDWIKKELKMIYG